MHLELKVKLWLPEYATQLHARANGAIDRGVEPIIFYRLVQSVKWTLGSMRRMYVQDIGDA